MLNRSVCALAIVVAVGACGSRTAPLPEPGTAKGIAPDLRGTRVLLLPVQENLGVLGDPDAELAFGLRERGPDVVWITAAEVEERRARSPAMQVSTRGLPVGAFLQAEVQRIGDPLYGELRRTASLVDARVVLIPVRASLEGVPGEDIRVRFISALVEVRSGRVVWFSVLEGGAFPANDPRGLASAVEEVARTMIWYGGR